MIRDETQSDRIIDRIRKLRGLANSNSEPHEVAAALAKATALMERHAIEECDIFNASPGEILGSWDVLDKPLYQGQKLSTWRSGLGGVCGSACGCFVYVSRIDIRTATSGAESIVSLVAKGRSDDLLTLEVLYSACVSQIDRLTAAHAHGRGLRWANSFRMGCVDAIHLEILREKKRVHDDLQGRVNESALVIVDTRASAAKESVQELGPARDVKVESDVFARFSGQNKGRSIYNATRPQIRSQEGSS